MFKIGYRLYEVRQMHLKEIYDAFSDKKIFVTGGAGFIGSNLVKYLVEKTNVSKVIVLDDLSSGHDWLLPNDDRVILVKGSILDEEKLKRCFLEKPDIVFHLAAHFANQNSVEHPETDLLVNGLGTLKVLQYASIANVSRFIYASSGCSVYGHDAPLPFREDMPPTLHYDTPYQIHKLLGELYCNYFHFYYKLPIVNLRFFNVYGPGEVPGRYRNVIPNFIYWALNKKPLPITGTGEETRDFTYVEDIVEGCLRAAIIPEAVGEAFNLASEKETKIIDLAKMINKLTGNDAGIIFKPKRSWDRSIRRRAAIEKAKRMLGYRPKVDIREGLRRTVKWFKENWDSIVQLAKF